jgi:CRP-like cAMP-binding protein
MPISWATREPLPITFWVEKHGPIFACRSNKMAATNLLIQRASLLQRFPLFSDVSPSDCSSILSTAWERRFARRHTIFVEGEPVRQIFVLLSGCVKSTQIGPNGLEVILNLNWPGEIVGAFGSCVRGDHCSTAQTIQPSTLLLWNAANFESILGHFPVFLRSVLRVLEQRLQELEERFREVSTEKVSSRLSSELIRLSKKVGRDMEGNVELCLSREQLAKMTGTTLFSVSRLLCQWESQGIVNLRREAVLVRDVEALTVLSQSE